MSSYSLIHVQPIEENNLTITDLYKSKIDYEIKNSYYKPFNNSLEIYELLNHTILDKENKFKTPIITFSSDSAISASTIAGVNEKFMDDSFQNSLVKIIYIDTSVDINTKTYDNYDEYVNSVISDVLGLNEENCFSFSRIKLLPSNLIIIGIDEDNNIYKDLIENLGIELYSYQLLKEKGIKKIMDFIVENNKDNNIHIVIDLECMNYKISPSVLRTKNSENTFNNDDIKLICSHLSKLNLINSIDITGYNFGSKEEKEKHHISNTMTIKTIDIIFNTLLNIKEKKINLFDENSKFLIWKNLEDEDHGWYIMRGLTTDKKEELIKEIDNKIISMTIDDGDNLNNILVSTTNINYQKDLCYDFITDIEKCCLYNDEKTNMYFELIN